MTRRHNTAFDDFLAEARGVALVDALARAAPAVPGALKGRVEQTGPCPVAGGKDGFSVNGQKAMWNCRKCGKGGRDGLSLVAHVLGHDLTTLSGLTAVCEAITGRAAPDGSSSETDAERAEREVRLQRQRDKAERDRKAREAEQDSYRRRARDRARRIYDEAPKRMGERFGAEGDGFVEAYLLARAGARIDDLRQHCGRLRGDAALPYWHEGKVIHRGPAMVAPFLDAKGAVIGCHCTWIDLAVAPKFRPLLRDQDGAPLPTKKMQGSKVAGLIPVAGSGKAARWVAGEGIETVLRVAVAEGFRTDTFYCAAGDMGNLCGPADPASAFNHPTATITDVKGRVRPVRVPGAVPAADAAERAMPVLAHVTSLVLLADGDSDRVMTAAAMARAKALREKPGRLVTVVWPGVKGDFADISFVSSREGAGAPALPAMGPDGQSAFQGGSDER